MKHTIILITILVVFILEAGAQGEPNAGTWKTWLIASGQTYRLPAPPSGNEIATVLQRQRNLSAEDRQQIQFWNTGAPGFRWQELMNKLWPVDTSAFGVLSNMVLGAATYDATIAAWDSKYAYKRKRPFEADARIQLLAPRPESPSYPCEHSVATGVAVTVISHFYPKLADSVQHMAARQMDARIAAGAAFPSDVKAGFELGKKIAEAGIARTKDFAPVTAWDGSRPQGASYWTGKPMFPTAGKSKTMVIDSASQYRPGPPPDYAADMAELKAYKPTFRSKANAFYYASQNFGADLLNQKLFEYNLALNPPRAARATAATAIATYDCFIACWDAKYAYWGIRPNQYDTTFEAVLPTPPFPGYPSGHAVMCGMMDELYGYLFPYDKALFSKKAKEGAESRFQGGIHFRTDNEVGLELGRKVTAQVIKRLQQDGADNAAH
jgi:membrane-associated phospholipid phosphatase